MKRPEGHQRSAGKKRTVRLDIFKLTTAFSNRENIQKNEERINKRLMMIDWLIILLAMSGLFLIIIENEMYYITVFGEDPKWYLADEIWESEIRKVDENSNCSMLRTTVIILNSFLNIFLYLRYKTHLFKLKTTLAIPQSDSLFSSGLWKFFILELLLFNFISIPKFNLFFELIINKCRVKYNTDQIAYMIQGTRILLLLRFSYKSDSPKEIVSLQIRQLCNAGSDSAVFEMKSQLKEKPYFRLAFTFFVFLATLSIPIRVAEKLYSSRSGKNLSNIWNSIWTMILTITTVGYGDYYPFSHIGRICLLFACLLGPFLISLTKICLFNTFILNENELRAFYRYREHENIEKVKVLAANVISNVFRFRKMLRTYRGNIRIKISIYVKIYDQMKKSFLRFRKLKSQLKFVLGNSTFDDIFKNFNQNVRAELEIIQNESKIIGRIKQKVKNILLKQVAINSALKSNALNMLKSLERIEKIMIINLGIDMKESPKNNKNEVPKKSKKITFNVDQKRRTRGLSLCQNKIYISPADKMFIKFQREQLYDPKKLKLFETLYLNYLCSISFKDMIEFMELNNENDKKRQRKKLRVIAMAIKKRKTLSSPAARASKLISPRHKLSSKLSFGDALKYIQNGDEKLEPVKLQQFEYSSSESIDKPINMSLTAPISPISLLNQKRQSQEIDSNNPFLLYEHTSEPEISKVLKLNLILESESDCD